MRARLEHELRAARDADGAAELKRRRRPHLAAWAVNQLARQDPEAIGELFAATNDVVTAQRGALAGGDPDELRNATRRRQGLIATLTDTGVALLAAHAPKPVQYRDNIAATLDAATLDNDAAATLRAGQLTQPMLPPAGFGPLDPLVLPGIATPRTRRPSSRDLDTAKRELEKAKRAAEKAALAAHEADAEVVSADLATQSALSHLLEVDKAQARARDDLAAANCHLTDVQEEARAAERSARAAATRLAQAEARLADLQRS